MAKELHSLGWDYLMFALFVAFTVFTPLWKRLFGKTKQRSKADYVFATGGVSLIAVMISIARGTLGVRTVLGYPSELYYYGTAMWEVIYGMASAYPIVCFVFVPIYFNLGITSVYQYLDLRFKSLVVRRLASANYIVRQICTLGITVYTPSVALSTVIGIPYWASITGMSIICIFFSIKGGLKAAINADVIQTVTVILVSLAVIIKGTIFSGGVKQVYEINRNDGRFSFFTFTGDLTVRVDTTSAWLGQLFMSLSQFGCQQNFMQRYVSLKSTTEVKRAMLSNIPVIFVFFSLSWLCGLVIYASYAKCDPLAEGYIQKPDEILPFYVEDQLAFIPGFLGIFMATLFNGALCMMVSNLNSLATVVWEDFLSFLPQLKGLSDKQQLVVIKTVTAVFGLIVMGVAFSVGLLSGVTESSMLTFSATSGPLLGCFILAMLIPIANWKGTSIGMISSCAIVVWMTAGGLTIDKSARTQLLPTSTEGCSNFTFSQSIHKPLTNEFSIVPKLTSWDDPNSSKFAKIANDTWLLSSSVAALVPTAATAERTPLQYFYSISYMYYSLIGTALTVIIGIIGSYLTQDPKDMYDAKLLHPIVFKLYQHFPGKKPYYVKDVEYTCDSVGSGANTTRGSGNCCTSNGGIENASNGIGIAAKINHAFEPQNEGNIIIAASATDAANNTTVTTIDGDDKKKAKNPMDVSFTPITTKFTNGRSAYAFNRCTSDDERDQHHNGLSNINTTTTPTTTTTTTTTTRITMPSGTYRQMTEKETL
ncbi:sodium-coupled monocarboxylate transporter 1 isoform 1-T2 [Glossina fuscipes fuscipes]